MNQNPKTSSTAKNVLGNPLKLCCSDPVTGFLRDGFCHVPVEDDGMHSICVELTDKFLEFSKKRGNDLSTPKPQWGFPGLKQGDHWCLCASRWKEAYDAGYAPRVDLDATHEDMLILVPLDTLKKFAF